MKLGIISDESEIRARIEEVSGLFCAITEEPGQLYYAQDPTRFSQSFLGEGKMLIAAQDENGEICGFAGGAVCPERQTAYLSFLAVKQDKRKQGIGAELLHALEVRMTADPCILKIDVVFHNPTSLGWRIPGADGADHPCAPGVDFCSPAYQFLQNRGYRLFAIQNSYYLPLSGYREPDDLRARREALEKEGISVTLYRPGFHQGLPELFDNIGNPGWKTAVLSHTDQPIVVAVDHQNSELVCGYTGPLTVQPQGRGNFCGIGTRTDYRGRGIGKLVFCEMCRRHAEAGARFMSLYTGENNPARNIYEAAGFRIVRSWANLRKSIRTDTKRGEK